MSLKGLRFTLNVDGLSETATAVVSFRLYQQYSGPFVLEVDIASTLPDLTAVDFLEKNALLTVWQGTVAQRYVKGFVTGVTLGEDNHWQMRYSLSISPPLWRCGLRQNFRIFQQQDIEGISALLLNENGITDWTPVLYEPHPAREFCVQYKETDLAFLTRLWAEEGIFFYDWHAKDNPDQKLVLSDDVAGVSALGPLPFNPNVTTEVATECISAFRYHAQIRPSSVETQDYTFKAPRWPGYYARDGENLNGQRTQYEIFDYPGRFKDEQHGESFARYQIDGLRHDAERAVCASNSPKLWPGKRFTLTGHPSATLNREWQVVSSVLSGEQPQALHGNQGLGTTMDNNFEVIPANRTWRPHPLAKPLVDGPQSAIVTGPAGEEIFCDEHGRVRVQFLWDRYSPGNEDSSCWVRVSQAWAGAGFGNLAIPRVGQEVIVDFLNGDPDQPIVMGRTYHQDNRSPGSLPGTKTQMTIRSKTYKGSGYNELMFEDATSKELLSMHAQKDMKTEVEHDSFTQIRNDQYLRTGRHRKINIAGNDDLYVEQEGKTYYQKDYSLSINKTFHVKAATSILAEAGKEFHLKAGSKIVLESGSEITLKTGSTFIQLTSSGIVTSPKVDIGTGCAGTGSGWAGRLPEQLPEMPEQILSPWTPPLPISGNQRMTLSEDKPFCEECEKCKNGECPA
ncbi:type VI secretion system Vgr family protein [Citrobacter telavivensis]